MKRILVLVLMSTMTAALCAQNDSTATATGDSSQHFKVQLGIQAGATLYANGNDHSPYYSKYGFNVQIPLLASWSLSPHWSLSTGLRYDFCWEPLYYAVEPTGAATSDVYDQGLQFTTSTTPTTYKQYAFHSYVGIPVQVKWYPWTNNRNSMNLGMDFFAGFAVSQYFCLDKILHQADGSFVNDGYNKDSFNAMNPWKMELGLNISTDVLGIVHGVRLFTNLLPTYKDPLSGEKIYMTGLSFYL